VTADHDHDDRFDLPPIMGILSEGAVSGIQVITEGELAGIIGPDMLDHLMAMLDPRDVQVYTPKRGTQDYRDMLEHGAEVTDLKGVTSGLGHLWDSYRWPGIVDYMEVLVQRIVAHPQPLVQDSRGRPRLDIILSTAQDEAQLMETAVAVSNEPYAKEQGLDFMGALAVGKELVRHMQEWRPIYQEAINHQADGHPELVRPALVKLPGLREDRDRVMQGALVLALAAISVSDPRAALDQCVEHDTPESELPRAQRRAKGRNRHK
jgi:hypothetical protein